MVCRDLKTGKPKAKPSVDKARRVLRLALCYAVEAGWLEKAPLPASDATPVLLAAAGLGAWWFLR